MIIASIRDLTTSANVTSLCQALAALDGVFISGHKFLGGSGTPGLLICKKHLFSKDVPVVPGGGTVLLVSKDSHTYLRSGISRCLHCVCMAGDAQCVFSKFCVGT